MLTLISHHSVCNAQKENVEKMLTTIVQSAWALSHASARSDTLTIVFQRSQENRSKKGCLSFLSFTGHWLHAAEMKSFTTPSGDHVAWLYDRRVLIVLITLVILTPLCLKRELNELEWVSHLPVLRQSTFAHTFAFFIHILRSWNGETNLQRDATAFSSFLAQNKSSILRCPRLFPESRSRQLQDL